MYFGNRMTALENEKTLQNQVLKSATFTEHQVAVAMFYTTMVSRFDQVGTRGWSQNVLQGYQAPEMGWHADHRHALAKCAAEVLADGESRVYGGLALIMVTPTLHKDTRFSMCPVGSVALFSGVVDLNRWGLMAEMFDQQIARGFFNSAQEYVVTDRLMSAPLFGRSVDYHGSEYVVGHLRRHNKDTLRKLNRELTSTFACVPFRSRFVEGGHTAWLQVGMRFDFTTPEVEILTAPEDTQPLANVVPIKGIRDDLGAMTAAMLAPVRTANAVLNVNGHVPFKSMASGMAEDLCMKLREIVRLDPTVSLGDTGALNKALAEYGCKYFPRDIRIAGPDGSEYSFAEQERVMHYNLMEESTAPFIHNGHHLLLFSVLAVAYKYGLPPGLAFSLMDAICTRGAGSIRAFTSKAYSWLVTPPKLTLLTSRAMDRKRQSDPSDPIELVCKMFCQPMLARSRATYHDGLNTKARKKLIAKFGDV